MIQTSFLNTSKQTWTIFIDGASRGNPGKSGAGIFVEENGNTLLKKSVYLGSITNNQAEYLALALAIFFTEELCHIKKMSLPSLRIISDSLLLVKQIEGAYSVKNPVLKEMKYCIMKLLSNTSFTIEHVLRQHNKKADALANLGIDQKIPMPEEFYAFICTHCPIIQDVLYAP